MLKHLLKDLNSFAIIATHSSIITREVDREAVNVLRRINNFTSITKPSIQTYGADLESIISEVFEDDLERKVYEDSLDQIIPDDEDEIDFIEVNSEVGNSGLIYLLNKSSDDDFQVEN
ncbi:hypothetical protein F946_01140 [Acinetobacter johnsonii ANC 3681]|uniref:Uncharacterized protein n=2 Tax=Acinetobacter johnsonii TaxID=40214 RepID=N9CXT9_ACIJO|nr:hypothetical protein F946_01140 [Acinetobacter johnsonii ANC 3681]